MTALDDRIAALNESSMLALAVQLRSPLGVIPFVGAGLSTPFGFPQWGDLLNGLAQGLESGAAKQVSGAVKAEQYERAATILAGGLGEYDLQVAIAGAFPDSALDTRAADVSLVPLLASGLVITTNFDGVLEHVFEQADTRFQRVVYGANPNEIVPAIQQNRRTLWKLHGDRNDPRTRVLASGDYDAHYRELRSLLALAFMNRPALFLGCKLETDRTVDVLQAVQEQATGIRHFALLQHPATAAAFDARLEALRGLGVIALWYPEGEHDRIRPLLSELVQRASAAPLHIRHKPVTAGPVDATTLLMSELRELAPPANDDEALPYAALLHQLLTGNVAFFLGAATLLGRLPLAGEFFEELRDHVGGSGELDNLRVTQAYADRYGRGPLDAKVNEMFGAPDTAPTAIHLLLATLPARLREKGYAIRPPLFLTTNFDDCMERALTSAGERYHLFSFRVEAPHAGHYVYRSPDGDAFVVDRPARFHRIDEDRPIVVKYHGGLHRDVELPIAYPFGRCDFLETIRRLPGALPKAVLDRVAESSLLFLGHGLTDESVEALMRARPTPRPPSWAVLLKPPDGWHAYWDGIGVEIVDMPLERFALELDQELERLPAKG